MPKKILTPEQRASKKISDHKHWEKLKTEHPERLLEKKLRDHDYYLNNTDKVKVNCTKYKLNNIDKVKGYKKKYYEKHKITKTPKTPQQIEDHRQYCKNYYKSHKTEKKQYQKDHAEEIRTTAQNYQYNNKDKVSLRHKGRYNKMAEDISQKQKVARLKIKTEVLTHYGNGKLACVRCGFDKIDALTIDHMNGDGAKHRKDNAVVRGCHIYTWLKKNNLPEGYQTLCMNCQLIKRMENHEVSNKYLYKQNNNETAK